MNDDLARRRRQYEVQNWEFLYGQDERPYIGGADGYDPTRPDASLPTKVVINGVFLVALVTGLLFEARWIKRGITWVLRRVL